MREITPEFIQEVYNKATLFVSQETLMQALDRMAQEMTKVLTQQNPIFLCVMNGGLMTTSELMLRLNFPLQLDYIHATRYCGDTTGGASIHWKREPSLSLVNRSVVIVDDILDKGVTLAAIIAYCKGLGAEKVYTAVLVDKTTVREASGLTRADFTGVPIKDEYVFGFGLDYHDYLRNIPAIYSVAKEHMF